MNHFHIAVTTGRPSTYNVTDIYILILQYLIILRVHVLHGE